MQTTRKIKELKLNISLIRIVTKVWKCGFKLQFSINFYQVLYLSTLFLASHTSPLNQHTFEIKQRSRTHPRLAYYPRGHYFDIQPLRPSICGQCGRRMQFYLKYTFKYRFMLIKCCVWGNECLLCICIRILNKFEKEVNYSLSTIVLR